MPTAPRLLIGIMSVLRERDRRDAMRSTWLTTELDPAITARFVLGRTNASDADEELHQHADIVILNCEENQHRGKTVLWFQHALTLGEFTHFAKMDQDVLLWPDELITQMANWPATDFYGGWPVDVHRRYWNNDRFVFTNGGLAVLSHDLAALVSYAVDVATPLQTAEAQEGGFIEDSEELRQHGIDLRGNEDVTLGRLFKQRWADGRLTLNAGWMDGLTPERARQLVAAGEAGMAERPCPFRHTSDLKRAEPYLRAWEERGERGCRCICPGKEPPPPRSGRKMPPEPRPPHVEL
jgi:hypothetical protein